jgi:hypothetical protein
MGLPSAPSRRGAKSRHRIRGRFAIARLNRINHLFVAGVQRFPAEAANPNFHPHKYSFHALFNGCCAAQRFSVSH